MTDKLAQKTKIFICTTDQTLVSSTLFNDYKDMYVVHNGSNDPFNDLMNEFTMIKWMGDNIDNVDAEYIGTAHYRRCLSLKKIDSIADNQIIATAAKLKIHDFKTYALFHNIDDYAKLLASPELQSIDRITLLNQMSSTTFVWKNIFLMPRATFIRYLEFAHRVYAALTALKDQIDINSRDSYQKRALGFLAERCTSAWILSQAAKALCTVTIAPIKEDFSIKSPYSRHSNHYEDGSSSSIEE